VKIAVVGAGPGGSFCAYHLARAGADVTLFDLHAEAWEKPCGGGVPPKVRERFAEIAAYDGPRRSVSIGYFISPDDESVRLDSRAPMWVVSRREFDAYLRRLALGAGAKFVAGRVSRVTRDGSHFVLHGPPAGDFDFVIGADGAKSVVRRDLCGAIPRRLLTTTVGYFLEAAVEAASSWFLPQPGYVWAFPRLDHVCLGGGSADPKYDVWAEVERRRQQHYPQARVIAKWAAPIPFIREARFFGAPISGEGFALVGDAAGHVDALTGEGILYALWDGQLLAQALLEGRSAGYEERWRAAHGAELAKAAELSRWFYDPKIIRRVFAAARRSPTMRKFLMDLMTDQPSYLTTHKLMLRRLPRIGLDVLRSFVR
jgi:flavin-dependent dehydrogenase